jgi:hypothetical protein
MINEVNMNSSSKSYDSNDILSSSYVYYIVVYNLNGEFVANQFTCVKQTMANWKNMFI